ncbi:MAG: hypothetical protein K2X29_14890 [Candidatus Obscuribacterales bacterium]|nr:hypothetical protein [Candidatus Obscuribacterales bacterium]
MSRCRQSVFDGLAAKSIGDFLLFFGAYKEAGRNFKNVDTVLLEHVCKLPGTVWDGRTIAPPLAHALEI